MLGSTDTKAKFRDDNSFYRQMFPIGGSEKIFIRKIIIKK